MRRKYLLPIILAAIVLSAEFFPTPGLCQGIFYQGKTLKIIDNDPGGAAFCKLLFQKFPRCDPQRGPSRPPRQSCETKC